MFSWTVVTESARAHSYILSKQVRKTCQFWLFTLWLLTFWLLTVYLIVVMPLFRGFVHVSLLSGHSIPLSVLFEVLGAGPLLGALLEDLATPDLLADVTEDSTT